MESFWQYGIAALCGFIPAIISIIFIKVPQSRREDRRKDYILSEKQCERLLESANKINRELMDRLGNIEAKHDDQIKLIRESYEIEIKQIRDRVSSLEVENARLNEQIKILGDTSKTK